MPQPNPYRDPKVHWRGTVITVLSPRLLFPSLPALTNPARRQTKAYVAGCLPISNSSSPPIYRRLLSDPDSRTPLKGQKQAA